MAGVKKKRTARKPRPAAPDPTGEGAVRTRDANLIRRAINERWPIPEAEREKAFRKCIKMLGHRDGRVAISAVKAIVAMEGQNQSDDHLADKNGRLDTGKLTENVGVGKTANIDALLDSDPEAMRAALALGRKLAAGGMPDALPSDT
jgi:hypothetical protein